MTKFWAIFLVLVCGAITPSKTFAIASDWQRDADVAVRIISGVDAVGQDDTVPLGLEVQMAPDWHTYWRSPGMAGLPPQIDWQTSLSEAGNLREAILHYPAPKRYTAFGLETIGYRDHVVFPMDAVLRKAGQALNLDTAVSLLVCSNICVPKNFALKLTVPEGAAQASAESDQLAAARLQMPVKAAQAGLLIQTITNDGTNLAVTIQSHEALVSPDIFVENDQNIAFTSPVIAIEADQRSATLTIKPADALPEGTSLDGLNLTLTVVADGMAVEQKITVPRVGATWREADESAQPSPQIAPQPAPIASAPALPLSLDVALLFALIGGLILNLMPCVLPVLSLKILSAIGHGGGEAKLVRRSFLMTAAGILFSFLVLAGVTIALKNFGLAFGWGVQFQQPLFVVGLVVVLTLFAANMLGLFEIALPRLLADGVGNAAYHPKLAGDFVTGAFATLLATPCTAPFLGTAIGFALAAGTEEILMIFAALGVGMALPYVAIALHPSLAIALPKPGVWMVRLRQILGVALLLTALWLLWVLAAQIQIFYAVMVGFCMIVMLLAVAQRQAWLRRMGGLVGVLIAIAVTVAGSTLPHKMASTESQWVSFSPQALADSRAAGKTVFLDVTAAWCLTCKANQQFILTQPDIQDRLFHSEVVAMQADWTNANPAITDLLRGYGRYGIPFNIVFGPGAPEGIVLPELLSHDAVMEALDKATLHQ